MAKISTRTSKLRQKPSKANTRKPQEERWSEIIEAATEIFWEKGYDGTSLQDIADRVGILKGSLYYYINSKTDLRAHLLEEAHHHGIEMISEIANSETDPLTRLYKMFIGHVYHVCKNMARTAVFLREIRRLSDEEKAEIGVDDRAYALLFQEHIKDAQSQGLLRPDIDPRLAGHCALGSLNAIYTWYNADGDITAAQLAHHMASTTLIGLATAKGLKKLEKILPAQEVIADSTLSGLKP